MDKHDLPVSDGNWGMNPDEREIRNPLGKRMGGEQNPM